MMLSLRIGLMSRFARPCAHVWYFWKKQYSGFICDLRHFIFKFDIHLRIKKNAKKNAKICICRKIVVILQRGRVGCKLFLNHIEQLRTKITKLYD